MRYTLVQRSMWSAFTLDIVEGSGRVVGEIRSPNLFQYKNARMAFHPPGSTAGNVKFKFQGVAYEVWVEVLRRAFINDVRYTLQKDQKVLASVDIIFKRGERFPAVLLRTPVQGSFRRTGSPWSRHFELHSDSKLLATVFHPHWITLRVHLAVEIAADQPVLPLVFAAYVIKEILY